LYDIEYQQRVLTLPGSETDVSRDRDRVHIEHIFPQRPVQEDWTEFPFNDEAEVAILRKRLGNLTLLSGQRNRSLGNRRFSEKRSIYRASSVLLTQQVGDLTSWTPDAIVEKQLDLADRAVALWPRGPI